MITLSGSSILARIWPHFVPCGWNCPARSIRVFCRRPPS